MKSKIYSVLAKFEKDNNIPFAYMKFTKKVTPPFIAYFGNGQYTECADNTVLYKDNSYVIQFYFKKKNETIENKLEEALTDAGFIYDKSPDVHIEDEDLNYVYYIV